MKKLFLVAAAALLSVAAIAQTPPPGGVGVVTPSATPVPTGVSIGAPSSPTVHHFNVTQAQLAAITGTTSGNFTLFTLPARSVIDQTMVKPFVSVAGTSISAATARVITANNNYGTAYDVFQSVGDTILDFDGLHPHAENFAAVTPVLLHITTTGANMSAISAGSIDVWVTYHTLP